MRLSLEETVERYQKSLYAAAFGVIKNADDANDAVEDTFIKYYTSQKQFEDCEHLKAWLLRVAINRAKDIAKSSWFKTKVSIDDCQENLVTSGGFDKDLFETVMSLPEKYRTVIHLHYYEDMTVKEIAGVLEMSEGGVKMRLSRGRNLLREALKEE